MPFIEPRIHAIVEAANKIDPDRNQQLLLFLGEKNHPDLELLIQELNQSSHSFFGGVFPGIISGTEKSSEGALVIPLPAKTQLSVIDDLTQSEKEIWKEEEWMPHWEKEPASAGERCTALILIDGLSPHIAKFLLKVHGRMGNRIDFFGGGAGYLSLEQKNCLFSNRGPLMDGALIAVLPRSINLGVRHGWKKIIGPLVATKTRKNVIEELNWENAFELYQRVVEEDSGKFIDKHNFFEVSKGYPFGLLQEGSEDIVRDPIRVDEAGGLVCVGEVPENSVLNILKGEPQSLISSAAQAANDSLRGLGERPFKALVVDCISRVLFLEEAFHQELQAVRNTLSSQDEYPMQGILSLGEISTYGEGFLEFFNKTIVVGLLEE